MRPARLVRPEGPVAYDEANVAMHTLAEERLADRAEDTLILLQHPPTYTAGRRWRPEHLVWSPPEFEAAGASLRFIDRGGSFTFHGPGQLVGYPILDLGPRPDALRFVRDLEEVVILAAADLGVPLHRNPVQTGVWSNDAKVCAIGVRLMRMRVSLHGFAVNCTTDLAWYDAIVPCGLGHHGVTSMTEVAGRRIEVADLAPRIAARFGEVFDRRLQPDDEPWPTPVAPAPDVAAVG
jgi:lipoyl(octanoyl) transferase